MPVPYSPCPRPCPGLRRGAPRRGAAAFTVLEAAVAGALVTLFLTGLFALNSNMMHLLRASAEAANASQLLQQRVEQARLANWSQLTDPSLYNTQPPAPPLRYNFAVPMLAYATNLPGLTEALVVYPYAVPPAALPANAPPPYVALRDSTNNPPVVYTPTQFNADGTVQFNPDGSLPSPKPGYSYAGTLAQQDLIRVDLIVNWPSLARTRTRALTTVVSRWGISK